MSDFEQSPTVCFKSVDGTEINLTWFNTRLRAFADEQFDHAEYRNDEGQLKGIKFGREILQMLEEEDFPILYQPYVDDATMEWMVGTVSRGMDVELEELLGGTSIE